MMLSSSVRKLVTLVGLSVLSFILLQGHTSVIGESSSLAASVDAYLAELDSAEFDALTREIYVQAELVDELDPVTMMMEMQARAQIEGTHQAEVETEADAEGETEGEVATEGEGEAEAATEGEAQAETATEGEAAAEGEAPAEGEAAAEGEATAEGEVAAEGEAAAEGGAEGEAAAEGEGEADNRKNGWEAPKLPPLAVGLTNETRPEIHPASGVPAGGVPPTQEELDGILAPQQPPEGCSHLIEAWKNYVWKFRTTSATGVVGKDQYTQAEVEVRFKNFCTNLKNHQLSLSSGRERMTIKLADLTFKNVSDEKLSWNKYFDYATLKPLRGFRYSLPFSHAMTHQQYLEREFIRNGGTDASPEARQQQLAQKLGELPNKINIAADGAQTPPAATAEAAEEPAAEAPAAAEGESETPAAEGEAPAAAEGEAEAPSGEGEAAASEEAAEGAATAVDVAVAFIEMADTLTDEPPVISTPTGALKPIARDPLVPDFDFSLNSNIVGPVMDQNNCGADWAIATSVLLEQTYAVQCQDAPYTQSLEQLHFGSVSAQQLISCATPTGRNGCQSGDVIDALKYAMRWPMRTIESYPLAPQTFLTGASETPSAPTCHVDPAVEASAAQPLISAFGHPIHSCRERNQHDAGNLCLEQDEEELARFVAKQPVTAVIDANDAVFGPTYSGYVITSKDCSSVVGAGDHVVIIVGLLTDADSGKKVWKIQNSYGQEWGEKGFAYLEYGYNTCGIANYNHYVQMTCQRPAGPNPLPRPPAPKIAPLSETASKPIEILPPKAKIQPTVPVVPVNPIIAPTSVPANPASGTHAGADSIPWWVRESATPNVVSPKLAQVGPKAPEPVRTTVPPLQTQPFVPIVPTVPVRPLPPAPVTATVPVPAPAQATPAIAPIAAGHVVNLATPIPAPAAAAAPVAAPPQPLAAAPQQAAPIQAQPVAAAVNVEPVQQQQPQAAPVAAPAVQVPVAIF